MKNGKLSYQSYFYSLTAKLIVFLMFDLFQYGRAAIHYATEGGHLEIIALLIKNGADANVKDAWVRKLAKCSVIILILFKMMYVWNVK